MKTQKLLAVSTDVLKPLKLDAGVLKEINREVAAVDSAIKINSFKVEQRIIQINSNNKLSVGSFLNGNANIESFKTRYLLVFFSNKFISINGPDGKVIRKRLGLGVGFTLNIEKIDTKVSANFSILAASAELGLSQAGYKINVYGVNDATIIGSLPNTGNFTLGTYKQIQTFIGAAKNLLKNVSVDTLYPIDILNQTISNPESAEYQSMYYGALKIKQGVKLNDAVENIRNKQLRINENVVQFMYSYFEIRNAYTEPNASQKESAQKWLNGKFSKKDNSQNSWVSIDPSMENGYFIALSHLSNKDEYKPHAIPDDWHTISKEVDDMQSQISLDFSSSLKLASILDASVKFNTHTIVRDISLFRDVFENPPEGSKILQTRIGVCIRFIVHISNLEFGTKINYSTIGAVSELNHANVEYEIMGIGISDTALLDFLPDPQDINQDTMASLNETFNKIKNGLSKLDKSKLDPQPFMIQVNEPEKIDPTLNAQAVVFAVKNIAEKNPLNDVIKEGKKLGLDIDIITSTYKNTFKISQNPDREARLKAEDWLDL